jgi:uncharacterized RDD family membrane protein YckC
MKTSYLRPPGQHEPALAPLEHRMGGRIVDMAIPFAMVVVASAALRAPLASNATVHMAVSGLMLGYLLFADGVKGGQSIGKRIFHTSVVDATTFAPCSLGQSMLRNTSLLFLHLLDWGFIFRGRRQRLGDRLAGTIVITTVVAAPPSEVPTTEGRPLSQDEIERTRRVYAGLATSRLEELLASPDGMRPGALELVRQELDRRAGCRTAAGPFL